MYIQEYRPKTFSEVRGQSLPLKVLKYIAKNPDNVCRSIILSGERGTGKTTCARIFAKAVNNPKRTGDADLENEFCNSIVRGSTLYQEYDSAIVGNVESIRSLRETFAFSITKGYRVILFDEIQESSPQAQAALLTVLEECPKGTFFLFCLQGDTLVSTETGLKKIKNISVGDKVITPYGLKKVTFSDKTGVKQLYRVQCKGGYSIEGTLNHKVRVLEGNHLIYKPIESLKHGDLIPFMIETNNAKGIDMSLKECEFYGRLFGDGYWNKKNFGILFNNKEWEYGESLLKDVGINYTPHRRNNVVECSLDKRLKKRMGLELYKNGFKQLFHFVYNMNKEQLLSFLKGWCDADSHIRKNGDRLLVCKSEKAIRDMQTLLMSFGISTSVYSYVREVKKEYSTVGVKIGKYLSWNLFIPRNSSFESPYRSNIQGHPELRNFLISKGISRLKYNTRNGLVGIRQKEIRDVFGLSEDIVLLPVESVISSKVEDVYDISVEDVECFLGNGMWVHNCTTNPEKLLPTIISRSIKLDFKTIDENELVDHLKSICEKESIDYTEDVLHMIARRTSGHARDSVNQLEMLKILGVEDYKRDYRYLLSDIQEFFSLVQIDKVKASNKAIQILSNPLLFVEQDFEVYMKSLADKVYVEGVDVPYGKEIIKIWLKSHRFLETTNDWYILLMSFSSLFVKKQTVTNRFGR